MRSGAVIFQDDYYQHIDLLYNYPHEVKGPANSTVSESIRSTILLQLLPPGIKVNA
jgi:hypothetical protein